MCNLEPMVSVVITTYKREPRLLVRAVESVQRQSYNNLEIIVVDDSPETYKLRSSVRDAIFSLENVIYIQHDENRGACEARNTGLRLAQGEFIAFLDDDDEWMPDKITKQIQCFTDDEIAMVYCGYKTLNETNNLLTESNHKFCEGYLYKKLLLEGNFIGSTSFVLLRKECLEEIGGFDPMMESAQDSDVWLRLAKQYKISCVKEFLGIYHIHDGERITSNFDKKINGITRLIEKNKAYIEENKYVDARYCRELAPLYASNGQFKEAIIRLSKAVKLTPGLWKDNLKCFIKLIVIALKK